MSEFDPQPAVELPKTASARPALTPSAGYRYRFPESPRNASHGFSVAEAAERLLQGYWTHRTCVRVIAGVLMRIGAFELKIELAHHLHRHAEAASALHARLLELRVSRKTLGGAEPHWLAAVCNELLQVADPVAFILCLRDVLVRPLHVDLRSYRDGTDALLDQPTVRVLGPILEDLAAMERWHCGIEAAALAAGDSSTVWRDPSARILRLADRVRSGEAYMPSACYKRPDACERDDRLTVFRHTRSYDGNDLATPPSDPLALERVELLRVQRDELDAIETFANVLFDMRLPCEEELLLARLVWDEARHAEMGQRQLSRLGYDPFAIPCGVIGINVRSPLPPILAMAQISIFGELNQLRTLQRMAERCANVGDACNARAFDFTHADELMHLRRGRAWLAAHAADLDTDLAGLERLALGAALRRLQEEGVLGEDYAQALQPEDIGRLLGE
jgi:hypothetical protein